jgi:hypothetical protein
MLGSVAFRRAVTSMTVGSILTQRKKNKIIRVVENSVDGPSSLSPGSRTARYDAKSEATL